MYIPCEMALAEFTFVDGVRRVYHTLINPGECMIAGFMFHSEVGCSEHSVNFQDFQ
jgi:hypothetical protein